MLELQHAIAIQYCTPKIAKKKYSIIRCLNLNDISFYNVDKIFTGLQSNITLKL